MKKTTCFISLAIAALFVSCSSTTDDASISLSVPREIVSSVFKSSDSPAQSDYAVKKIKCTLLDKNEKEIDSQTDDIAENTNTVITFSGIPAGTKVSVSATIYGSDNENSPEYRLYTGVSDKITVKPGNNTITLKLKKATTTVVLYNKTSDTTVSSLSYATLTDSGISNPTELLANTNGEYTNNPTEIVDYCFDTSNNMYAIVQQTGENIPYYSINKYEYNGSGYSNTPIIYDCIINSLNYISHIEAADNDTLYAGVGTDSGAKIAKITFTAPNKTSENGTATFTTYDWSDGEYYSIYAFCTDYTDGIIKFYIVTSIGLTKYELASYTVSNNVLSKGNSITLYNENDKSGIFFEYHTNGLHYSDLCYINGTLYLLVNDINLSSRTSNILYSRGALCTFKVSESGITEGSIGIGYQTKPSVISTNTTSGLAERTAYFGDGTKYFYGPVKFVARKDDELLIADNGYYIEGNTVRTRNSIVKVKTSNLALESFTPVDDGYFKSLYSGDFSGSVYVNGIDQ